MPHPTEDPNFRLPASIRPSRYVAHLAIDPERRTFSGQETIELRLDASGPEIVLHAADLDLTRVAFRSGDRVIEGKAKLVPATETAILQFSTDLPKGAGAVEIEWTGRFSPGLRGLYSGGRVAVTQFETADARRVFPCFDEPAFKARWAISAEVPSKDVALSNGEVLEEEPRSERKLVRFAETEILSTYLIALAVGDLARTEPEKAGGVVPVRTWSVPEKTHLTRFAQDAALAVLPKLQDYFGLAYAFGKLDQVAVPDFEAGAMENAGLITYREVALLLDPKTAALPVQKRVAEVITHELAHQWFGNWVTMVWWDDLWLNEAFATWMSYKIVDQWRPEWRIWLDFDEDRASALVLDALKSTHPIRAEVRNVAEAIENFDAITYEKGGAVLRMIEAFLGADRFREGIRTYMKRHARANAVADDLWRALEETSQQPVVQLANGWIRQSGYPLIALEREGRRVKLSQRRFYSEPGVRSEETWPVPIVLRYRDDGGVREHRLLLTVPAETVELPGAGDVRWVCGNSGNTGFYRVAYDSAGLTALASDLPALEAPERIALLGDLWARVRSGEEEIATFLELASRYGAEEDYAVLDELVDRLETIDYRLVPDAELNRLRAFVRDLLGPQLEKMGWEARDDEPGSERLRRAAVVRAVAVIGRSPEAVRELRTRLDRVLDGEKTAIEPNLHDAAVVASARAGDAAFFERILAAYQSEKDPAYKRRYLRALTAFEADDPAARGRELAMSEIVPLQDFATYVGGLLSNPVSRKPFWRSLREAWGDLEEKMSAALMIFRRVVEALGYLRERVELEEARQHLEAHPRDVIRQASAQTLERLAQDVVLRERVGPQVPEWLRARRSSR
jgi:puromycin-sensitive aminopeptidase